jgi:H+/Cl- antiporter ClcA
MVATFGQEKHPSFPLPPQQIRLISLPFLPTLIEGGSGVVYLAERPAAFAVVGMAAFFTAVVRAPVTGIILVTEMTGSFTLLLPMLLACFAAMTVPALLGDPLLYDSLTLYALKPRTVHQK